MSKPKQTKDTKKEILLEQNTETPRPKKTSPKTIDNERDLDRQFKDVIFAFMWGSHIIGMLIVGSIYGKNPYDAQEDDLSLKANFKSIASTVVLFFLFATFLSVNTLMLLTKIPLVLIRLCLAFNIFISFVIAVFGLMTKNVVVSVIGFVIGAWSTVFTVLVWSRLSFAAANLRTSLLAIKYHPGLFVIAFVHLIILFAWTIWWVYTAVGVINASTMNYCDDWECDQFRDWASVAILAMSYLWTFQVIKNTLHVTVAGTVGSWWHSSETPYKSVGTVKNFFLLAATKSIGSICVGSTFVAIAQSMQRMRNYLQKRNEDSVLLCCTDLILKCCQGVLEYFNEWAYVYVGLYGLSYVQSGKRVRNLFIERGWTTLLTDNVVGNLLFTTSVVIALLCGLAGLTATSSFDMYGKETPTEVFMIGVITGFFGSRIFMSVVASAVNAVIVCFAEAPEKLAENYPQFSQEMRDAWEDFSPTDGEQYEV